MSKQQSKHFEWVEIESLRYTECSVYGCVSVVMKEKCSTLYNIKNVKADEIQRNFSMTDVVVAVIVVGCCFLCV